MAGPGVIVDIPYAPRKWARGLHSCVKRWCALVLHRRAGKTTAVLNHHQMAATDDEWERVRLETLLPDASKAQIDRLMDKRRIYWHVMPTLKQAKLVAWDMLKDFSRPIPGVKHNNSELEATYPNGNKVRLIGADNPDSLRGPGLSGVSLDEYSQIHPSTFGEVLSKALGDQLGYAVFCGTIKGHDQLFKLHGAAKDNTEWYAVWQDIDVSLRTEEGATITALRRAMEDDRKLVRDGVMSQAEFDQEWYLSPEAAIKGAIYAKELEKARADGRVTSVPFDPALPVDTDWDLGIGDAMAIWFSQSTRGGEVRLIDYHEASGEGFPYYAKVLVEKGYAYGKHWAPHDISVRELSSGKSRLEVARAMGLKFEVTPRLQRGSGEELEEGIHSARMLFPRCWFDAERCKPGLEALAHYRRDYNERLNEFKATPVHDWASHGSDAFRGLAVRHQIPVEEKKRRMAQIPKEWAWT